MFFSEIIPGFIACQEVLMADAVAKAIIKIQLLNGNRPAESEMLQANF